MGAASNESMFPSLSAEENSSEPQEIESLCVSCYKEGVTKLLLTKIPHYKEIILMSFNCDHCGFNNNEIQAGGVIQEQGLRVTVTIASERDLSRQVVKSDYATVKIAQLELEIPPKGQKGEISTVEGVLQRTVTALEQDQPVRRHMDPEGAEQIDSFVCRIQEVLRLEQSFTLELDDPSGNSFIENPHAPGPDPGRTVENYERNKEQNHQLGLYTQDELQTAEDPVLNRLEEETEQDLAGDNLNDEVLSFPTNCHECNAPAETKMKMTNIPYFKEVVIMATVCELCGAKTNEVKAGGGIEAKGKKITLRLTDPTDLSRDVLKSETCSILIPELEFEMGGHALGGRFTTIEGLMANMLESVEQNSLFGGDGVAPDVAEKMAKFKQNFTKLQEGREEFTLVLDDPAGNSYLQNVYAPDDDPELSIELYERSYEQNDDLGLNDMKVEGYQEEN